MGKLDTKQWAGQAHEYELEPNIDTEEEKEGLKASLHFLIILQIALLYNHTQLPMNYIQSSQWYVAHKRTI